MAGVYIGWPFCAQKCTFCNFASGVFPKALEAQYLDRLVEELQATAWPWIPETVYLGGGTPGAMSPESLRGILAAIPGRPWREATLEVAPGAVASGQAAAWAEAGINRVSLGVQSFVEDEIRGTGRRHTAAAVRADVAALRSAGLGEVNIDLIAGLPAQTPAGWNQSLDELEGLQVPHVSVYMLEVDEDSRLGRELLAGGARYGALKVPAEAEIVEFYEQAVERLARIGLPRYEISNFASPGHESVHNLKYWRREPYLGFGADAHSFDGGLRWHGVESPAEYAAQGGLRLEETAANGDEERFFVGLRLMEGVEINPPDLARHGAAIARLAEAGLVELSAGRLRLTSRGVLLSNEVFEEFLPPCHLP
jgi:oxygen-independent coproporphyrinogen-3 oxidase